MRYRAFQSFVLRTPLLSFTELDFLLKDKETLLSKLIEPKVQEAIRLASPILHKELQKLLDEKASDTKEYKRILYSIERYISRMSTRCTPFGLFAGCSIGTIENHTNIELNDTISRKTRLDMYYLCTLYDALIKMPDVRFNIKFYPNSSLYSIGKKYRYVEHKYIGMRRLYQISEVEHSIYLNRVLKLSQSGTDIKIIMESLVSEEISETEALYFINELIDSQILVGELNQVVTGGDYLHRLIDLLKNTGETSVHPLLEYIKKLITKLDSQEENNKKNIYDEIIQNLNKIDVPYEEKFLFQTDMFRDTDTSLLGTDVISELESTMGFLNKISLGNNTKNTTLSQFQKDFYDRYEDREIPLLEALDPEFGIGYPSKKNDKTISPLVDNLYIPANIKHQNTTLDWFRSVLLKKTIECLNQNKEDIVFSDDDVVGISSSWDDLPSSISAFVEVIRANSEDILINLKSCGGNSAANLLARFAHIDERIHQLIKDITKKDQELTANSILAEIVYLPEARTGNILYRPHIREYEILYMTSSDLPPKQLIYPSDLVLSIKKEKLVIYSKKLKKQIIPRLTTAHSYYNNPMPIYRFLCDMQMQTGRSSIFFSWGQLTNEFPFRPRVRYKNTILSPASWSIKIKDMNYLFVIEADILIFELEKWRKKMALPPYVLMQDNDNELFVDWNNLLSIHSLFSIIKNRLSVTFIEFLFEPENAVVKKGSNTYLNEFIIAFHKEKI
ncbi:lantibiotic dehydratase family protein [Dysgonomonas sp. HGC4]|uniref:lantibiotic dehydratase family protein n=1 Tax=Dysgonomonas sp. HGC4 TaxID=1658009 RepID=UPI000680BCD1|nr:lantibiotic dehydratase family protein [Dysgonomonas sp. HGC4]MBD8348361.1 lantibiotic dehydratase family protein [Dysgonomonas sp. HGC4]